MAQTAVARNCPHDGTLVTCSGDYADEQLVGQCPVCQRTMNVANASYMPGVIRMGGEVRANYDPVLEPELAKLTPEERANVLDHVRSLIAARPVDEPVATEEPVTQEPEPPTSTPEAEHAPDTFTPLES